MASDSEIVDWPSSLPAPLRGRTQTINPRSEVTRMESGRVRNRRLFGSPILILSVEWNLTEDQFEDFKSFHETDLLNGSLPFRLTTYDRTSDVSILKETIWTLAFWEGKYSEDHSDNLFHVTAQLLVVGRSTDFVATPDQFIPRHHTSGPPPLVPVYTPCSEEFSFEDLDVPEGAVYRIQIAESSAGPWFDHIFIDGDGTPKTIRINNDYNGVYWFRLVDDGSSVIASAVNPHASDIQPPTVEISDVEDVSLSRPMWGDGGFTYPYSRLENSLINQEDVYIVPRGRGQSTSVDDSGNWDSVPEIVTVSGDPLATHKWTRDGNDPVEDMVIPRLDDYENNAAVARSDFGFAIKARSFKGACRSPMTLVLLDKKVKNLNPVTVHLLAQSETGYCDHTRTDHGTDYESAASCLINYGSPTIFESLMKVQVKADEQPAIDGSGHRIMKRAFGFHDSVDYLGWTNHIVDVTAWDFDFVAWGRSTAFDSWPKCYTFLEFIIGGDATGFAYIDSSVFGETITTPLGSTTGLCDAAGIYINNFLSGVAEAENMEIELAAWAGILTLHHDFKFFRDGDYVAPSAPDLPDIVTLPEGGFYDTFESYTITSDADAATLADGIGWTSNWVVETFVLIEGYDEFETYTVADHTDTSDLDDGSGWTSEWILEMGYLAIYQDTFESYSVGAVGNYQLRDGTGWDDTQGNEYWVFDDGGGVEDWESYSTTSNADAATLSAGTLWSGNWVVGSP